MQSHVTFDENGLAIKSEKKTQELDSHAVTYSLKSK